MSDPISILGTAVGIVSLGIQVCQGLVQYYASWKDSEQQVATTISQVSNLSNILIVLRSILAKHDLPIRAVPVVQESVLSCEDGIKALEKKLTKIKNLGEPQKPGLKNNVSVQFKKIAYPFKESTVIKLREVVSELRNCLSVALNALQLDVVGVSLENVEQLGKQMTVVVNQSTRIEEHASRAEDNTVSLMNAKAAEERQQLLTWLSSPDPSTNHDAARRKHQSTTGDWLISSLQFDCWKHGANSFFWIHGIPGSGKTILCSTIIDFLRAHVKSTEIGVAYFYFDFSDPDKGKLVNCLRSLVQQLFASASAATPLKALEEAFMRCNEGRQKPTTTELEALLRKAIATFEKAYIVVDALDECSDFDRLVDFIETIQAWKLTSLHLLVTSRRVRHIQDVLDEVSAYQISMQTAQANDDIRKHIKQAIETDRRLRNWPEDVKLEIESVLIRDAQGMFRWVACQLDVLRKCLKPNMLKKALYSLPKDLNETYERILLNIEQEYRHDVRNLLQALAYSKRPLSLLEAAEVVAFAVDETTDEIKFDPAERLQDPRDVLRLCGSLVIVEARGTLTPDEEVVVLAHASVRDYLLSSHLRLGKMSSLSFSADSANAFIAKICIMYLLQFDKPDSLTKRTFRKYPFVKYSALRWAQHASTLGANYEDPALDHLILALIHGSTDCYMNFLKIRANDKILSQYMPGQVSELQQSLPSCDDFPFSLHFAVRNNLVRTTKLLFQEHVDPNLTCRDGMTALHHAASEGSLVMMRLLLNNGADSAQEDGSGKSALWYALRNHHAEIAKVLLDRNPTLLASRLPLTELEPDHEILKPSMHLILAELKLKVLLVHGDFDPTLVRLTAERRRMLESAAGTWFEHVRRVENDDPEGQILGLSLELLDLSNKSFVKWLALLFLEPFEHMVNPLLYACFYGLRRVVSAMLEKEDCLIYISYGTIGTALHVAVEGGFTEIVRLLVDHGADVNARRDGWPSTPCSIAAAGGKGEIVTLLLDNGAHMVPQDRDECSILEDAAWNGRQEIVQLLYDKTDLFLKDDGFYGKEALVMASAKGHSHVVGCLMRLSEGERSFLTNEEFRRALQAASSVGSKRIVQLILDRAAELGGLGDLDETMAMHQAVLNGHKDVVKFLLSRSQDANSFSIDNRPDLHVAVEKQDGEMVQLLLDHGASVELKNNSGKTAIDLARDMRQREHSLASHDILDTLLAHRCDTQNGSTRVIEEYAPKPGSLDGDTFNANNASPLLSLAAIGDGPLGL